ncbi:hypothetical protein EW145_g7472, partial [Phellinidium pouzarii]
LSTNTMAIGRRNRKAAAVNFVRSVSAPSPSLNTIVEDELDTYRGVERARYIQTTISTRKRDLIEDFERYYLRDGKDHKSYVWYAFKTKRIVEIEESKTVFDMYKPIVRLLTKISVLVSKGKQGKVLAFIATGDNDCLSSTTRASLRPDIVAIWVDRAEAVQIANGTVSMRKIYGHEVVSLVEIKKLTEERPTNIQTGTYLNSIPRDLPNMAGMLLSQWGRKQMRIYWSDPSGIVHSSPYKYKDPQFWKVLFNFVRTLINPLPSLPTRDQTMAININDPLPPTWNIKTSKKLYDTSMLFGACAHTKQTCVFWDKDARRVIKDIWQDDSSISAESDHLNALNGVPGNVQLDYSEIVTRDEKGGMEELFTSDQHSGSASFCTSRDRRVPLRVKHRYVLKSSGDPLSKRTNVRQVLVAIYDSIQGHQLAYNKRHILHRDISRNNILINVKHHDSKFEDLPEAKFIRQVLNPSDPSVKEEGIVIDWDSAIDMKALNKSSLFSKPKGIQIGTRMFVSVAVATGEVRKTVKKVYFPELSGRARELYDQAYGKEKYEKYRDAVNNAVPKYEITGEEKLLFLNAAHHDMESFYWVLVYELLAAWPEGEDKCLSSVANNLLTILLEHEFNSETRHFEYEQEDWENLLHPSLKIVAVMMFKIQEYFSTEWAYWANIPGDHCHEAVKVIMLQTIVELDEAGDPIALRPESRRPERRLDIDQYSSYWYANAKASQPRPRRKRSFAEVDNADMGESSQKKAKWSGSADASGLSSRATLESSAGNTGVVQSRSVKMQVDCKVEPESASRLLVVDPAPPAPPAPPPTNPKVQRRSTRIRLQAKGKKEA